MTRRPHPDTIEHTFDTDWTVIVGFAPAWLSLLPRVDAMCRELEALGKSISEFAGRFDAKELTSAQAGAVMRLCARIEASIGSVKALAVARYARSDAWKVEGFRSPADQLAVETGMSPSHARQVLDTGRRMSGQPDVAAAALAGELSADQAAAVSDGVAANPSKARELIERARHASVPELYEEVARVKAAAVDQEARRRARHAKRSLRRWTDREGAFHAHFYGHPEDGALLWQALDPIRRRLIVARREAGDPNQPLEALDYDAAMTLAGAAVGQTRHLDPAELADLGLFPDLAKAGRAPAPTRSPPAASSTPPPGPSTPPPGPSASTAGPSGLAPGPSGPSGPDQLSAQLALLEPPAPAVSPSPSPEPAPSGKRRRKRLGGSPTQVLIRIDYDSLVRGHPLEGELCEMIGHGPLPVSVVEEILADANPAVAAVLTRHERLLGVYHFRRRPTAHQKTALNFLYPTCAARGCNARIGLQSDHRFDWANTHYTLLDGLDRLCPHHHGLKTRKGWGLVEGTGKRAFVPPTDPRHPRHRPAATSGSPDPP